MDAELTNLYGNKVRVRVCGLCWQDGNLLMVNHQGLTQGDFWAPPGGGLAFAEPVQQCLQREFAEETGLKIRSGRFLFGCEFIKEPLHAIELYFEVAITGGTLQKGEDPECPIIRDVRFMSPDELLKIPAASLHGIFRL
ncbi:MAG: NUDIX hydrolase, partial [Cyclobacteriaceae bacterium]